VATVVNTDIRLRMVILLLDQRRSLALSIDHAIMTKTIMVRSKAS